ncbi:MAG: domain containing protein [Thermoleophilia bacterium]|nr:domain containing protein [Thermoleophilia bacterium]MCZ4495990.1 domain containing protein [Thermoleophilia bacterium]
MIQQLLFIGQILVVGLIYLFVWRVVRGARRDLAAPRGASGGRGPARGPVEPQDSTIIPVADVQAARRAAGLRDPRLVVEASAVLRPGIPFTIGGGLSFGRAATNDVVLDEGVVSGRHARIIPPGTVIDEGSTNGTFVNGLPVTGRTNLQPGDAVQVGSTVFRYEGVQ